MLNIISESMEMQTLRFYCSILVLLASITSSTIVFAEDPLLVVLKKNDHASIDSLLSRHHNPNVVGAQGETPLMIAAVRSDYVMAKKLIDAGAKITYADNKNRTALWFAAFKSDKEMMWLFLKQKGVESIINNQSADTKDSALHFAVGAATCDVELLRRFVTLGADTKLKNIYGQTPITICSSDKTLMKICREAGIQ